LRKIYVGVVMKKIKNPFVITGYISEKYFCDREKETEELIRYLTNGQNVAMISPRRMGKTGLITHCFHKQALSREYHTFFIDIYATGNLREFIFILGKQIFEQLKPKGRKFIDKFFEIASSLRPAFKLDHITGQPVFDIGIGEISQPEYSLEQIFTYLEKADKPCIVAFDEFQQIAKYPEGNIEALLRTHIQQCKNTNFIFAGSQQHMMEQIFFSASKPFYQSVNVVNVQAIALESYVPFVRNHFAVAGKTITTENIERVYNLFEGHTWYIQTIFNILFSHTESGEECTFALIKEAVANAIVSHEAIFKGFLSMLSERQKELLYAIAKEKKAINVTSAKFIKKHALQSASAVQTAMKQLIDKEIITKEENIYSVYDRLLGLWILQAYGSGYNL